MSKFVVKTGEEIVYPANYRQDNFKPDQTPFALRKSCCQNLFKEGTDVLPSGTVFDCQKM